MGLNRLVLHPKYGSCIQLESILYHRRIEPVCTSGVSSSHPKPRRA
jgi:hypothetical protein